MAVKLPHNYLCGVRQDVSLGFAIRDLGQGMLPPELLRTWGLNKEAPSANKATSFSLKRVRRVTVPFTLV
jgi:hypothetical protein